MPKYNVTFREEQHWMYTFTVEAEDEIDAHAQALLRFQEGDQAEDTYVEDAYSGCIPEFIEKLED